MSDYTVVIPCLGGRTLDNAIKSALNQSRKPNKIIIVDDCSAPPIERRFSNYHVEFIRLPHRMGAGVARLIGYKRAETKYVAFLDSDDFWHPNKMELQLGLMDQEGSYMSWTDYRNVYPKKIRVVKSGNVNSLDDLYKKKYIIGCSTVVLNKKEINLSEIPYLLARNDYQMWIECYEKMSIDNVMPHHINRILVDRVIQEDSLSRKKSRIIFNQGRLFLLRNTPLKSIYYLFHWAIRGLISSV